MDADPRIRVARWADIDPIASLAGEALRPTPLGQWLVPDPAQRRQVLTDVLLIWEEHALFFGDIHLTDDQTAAAVAFHRYRAIPPPANYRTRLTDAAGPYADRFDLLDSLVAEKQPAEPHYHPAMLIVRPDAQGAGRAAAMLTHHRSRIDHIGLPSWATVPAGEEHRLARHGYTPSSRSLCPTDRFCTRCAATHGAAAVPCRSTRSARSTTAGKASMCNPSVPVAPHRATSGRQLTIHIPGPPPRIMAFPSRYPPDLIDAVVQRVADARRVRAYGAVTSVARQLNLDPRLVQKWVIKATAPVAPQPGRPDAETWEAYLPEGLLHCKFCHQPMTHAELPDSRQGYRCQQGCRPRPLDAAAVADAVGRAILRHTPRIIPATGTPTPAHLAAIHAHRVLARITTGTTASDITLTWRATPKPIADRLEAERAQRVATARHLALSDPLRARQLLHDSLTGVDPTTAPAHPLHAEAATLLAELQLRLGHPTDATPWATYAHHSTTHLHGPAHRQTLHALHLLATAHRRGGHHQRAHNLYRQLAEHLATTDGPHAQRTLAVHATTALVLHTLGHCQAARALLADTITTHRREHPGHPATARMTQHLRRIWHDCATKGHHHQKA
ncbi:hypothetical protein [Micromonospora aurantiaca (nom. illeg.)]|uniref:hypothetical protein n=1 Tax=Micromonospora aurantiaca (nom. illeg.) TaxID=47850 RepID=UPI0035B337A0